MPIFEIKNYTHYNTEDLAGLLDTIEQALTNQGIQPERSRVGGWRPEKDRRLGEVVAFKDFTTKLLWDEDRNWVKGRTVVTRTRKFVKRQTGWQKDTKNEVRIVPPKKLWVNPLEGLAEAGKDGVAILPAEGREQLIVRLFTLYEGVSGYRGSIAGQEGKLMLTFVKKHGPQIRVEEKRQGRIEVEEKHRVARHAAYKTWLRSEYDVRKLAHYGKALEKSNESALRTLRRSKVPMGDLEEEVNEAVGDLLQAARRCGEALNKLKMAYRPDDGTEII